jgi:hypothetical protein
VPAAWSAFCGQDELLEDPAIADLAERAARVEVGDDALAGEVDDPDDLSNIPLDIRRDVIGDPLPRVQLVIVDAPWPPVPLTPRTIS